MSTTDKKRETFIQAKIQLLAEMSKVSSGEEQKKITEFLQLLIRNQAILDSEENSLLEQMNQHVMTSMDKVIQTSQDSEVIRELRRLLRGVRGKRLDAEVLAKLIGSSQEDPSQEKKLLKELFIKHLQYQLDFLQDVCENKLEGRENLIISFLLECVDEILVSHHLAQQSFAGQAFAHLRKIGENIDLIELVRKDEGEFQRWLNLIGREHWNQYKPSEVRKRLKRGPEAEKIYGIFSKLGTHPTFESIQSRVSMSEVLSEKGIAQFCIQVGGTPNKIEADISLSMVLPALLGMMKETFCSFGRFLNVKEQISSIKNLSKDAVNFLVKKINVGKAMNPKLKETIESLVKDMEEFQAYEPLELSDGIK